MTSPRCRAKSRSRIANGQRALLTIPIIVPDSADRNVKDTNGSDTCTFHTATFHETVALLYRLMNASRSANRPSTSLHRFCSSSMVTPRSNVRKAVGEGTVVATAAVGFSRGAGVIAAAVAVAIWVLAGVGDIWSWMLGAGTGSF